MFREALRQIKVSILLYEAISGVFPLGEYPFT